MNSQHRLSYVLRTNLRILNQAVRYCFFLSVVILCVAAGFSSRAAAQSGAAGYVQANYACPQTPTAVVPVTFTEVQRVGDLNLVVIGWYDTTAQIQSVVDSTGNSYALAVGPTVYPGLFSQSIYYAKNIVAAGAGANTVTVTFSAPASYPDIRIAEYSGLDRSNPLDTAGGTYGFSALTDSGTVTTSNANDLLISANTVSNTTLGAGTGYVERFLTSDCNILEDRLVTAAGGYNATSPQWEQDEWVAQLVAFRLAPGMSVGYIQNAYNEEDFPDSSIVGIFTELQSVGNTNVVIVSWGDSAAQVQSVTDSLGNTYTLAAGPTVRTSGLSQVIYYARNIVAAVPQQNQVTVTFNESAVDPNILIAEYSGLDTANPLDVSAAGQGSGSSANSGSVALTNWNDLLVGGDIAESPTSGPGAGFVERVIATAGSLQDQVTSATGNYSATAPLGSSGNWIMQMAAFKSAAGSAGPNAPHIDNLSPNTGPIGTLVTITGSNFGATRGSSTVAFNGTIATSFSTWTANSISVYVPAGSTSGNVVVSVGTQWSNGVRFNLPKPTAVYVQGNSQALTGSQSIMSVAYAAAQIQHDLNLVVVGWKGPAPIQSVSDTMGNSYSLAGSPTVRSGYGTQAIYVAKNLTAAAANQNTVTVVFTQTATSPDVRVAEYQGLDLNDPVDVMIGATGYGEDADVDSGDAATTNAYDLLVGADYGDTTLAFPGYLYTGRLKTALNNILEDLSVSQVSEHWDASVDLDPTGQWIMQMIALRMATPPGSINQPPQVSAGQDQTITLPTSTVTLAGTVTDDGLPNNTLAISWSQLSGPGNVTFGSPSSALSTATFPAAGVYVLQLLASDSQLSASATVTITVNSNNQPPVVSAGPNQTITLPVNSVILEGTATDDGLPSGILTVSWSKVSGPGTATFSSGSTPLTQATFSAAGVYVLQLSASDTQLTTTATTTITVNSVPAPVTAITLTATRSKNVSVSGRTGPWLVSSTFNSAYTYDDSNGITAPISYPVAPGEQVTFKYVSGSMSLGSTWGFTDANGNPAATGGNDANGPGRFIPGPTPLGGALMGAWTDAAGRLVALPFAIGDAATAIAPPGAAAAQMGVNDIYYNDNAGGWTIKVQAGFPAQSTTSGNNVTGSTQSFIAFVTSGGVGVSGASVQFVATGANPQTSTVTTAVDGSASFTYTGTHSGTDIVHATAVSLSSNTVNVPWITPVQNVSTSTSVGKFFLSDGSCSFNTPATTIPTFVQEFPTINFNPPAGTIPGNTSGVGVNTHPFTDITTDTNGNFVGTAVAQGNGYQAGVSPMDAFQAVYTGTFTIGSSGNVTLNFFVDRGFIFGIGDGATRISGVLTNPPSSGLTPFTNLTVMGASNDGTAGGVNGQALVVNFPGAGTYQYELDYTKCGPDPLTLTMAVGQSSSIGIAPSGYLRLWPGDPHIITTGGTESMTVAAQDASGSPVANLGVALIVNGVNKQQFNGTTNSSGQATFSYVGSVVPGTDTNEAVANINGMMTLSNQDVVLWNPPGNVLTYVFTPQGWIGSPLIGATVQGQVPITLASGVAIAAGTLSYWPTADPTQVHVLNSNVVGTAPLTIGTIDATTLANGEYTVRFDAIASTGAAQRNEIVITVTGDNKPGRILTTVTDLKIPLAGLPINISRTYDSLERGKNSDFGFGWALSTNMDLAVDRLKNVSFTIDGQRRTFYFSPKSIGTPLFSWLLAPNYVPQAGLHGSLTQNGGCGDLVQVPGDVVCLLGGDFVPTSYTYTDPIGRAFTIAASGALLSIKEMNGVTLTYASNGIISSAGGVVVPFIRDTQGRITQITDLAGNQYTYNYDSSGNLASVRLPATTSPIAYTYSSDHLLLSQTDARGNSTTQTYDSSGRLQSVTNLAGTTQYSYNVATNTTTTTFPDGGVQVETDNSFGKPLSITDPLNRTTTYTYDTNQNMLTTTNPLNKTWTYTYDTNGFQTSVTDPLTHTTSTGYNQFGGPTSFVNAANTITVSYDVVTFNPLHADDSIGQLFASTYDASGNPLTRTDANGKTTHFTYDTRGNLLTKTDPLIRTTTYTYDSMDRLLTETDPRQHTTTHAYDGLGRLTSKTDALTHATTYTYDDNGNKLTEKDALNHQTSYQYDALNRLTNITYPDNTNRQYTYNFRGQKLTETDQSGRVTQYQYDLAGQLSQMTYAFGTPDAGTMQYTYDAAGRKTTVKDERNNVTTYTYDDAGRLKTVVNGLGQTWSYSYDAANRRTAAEDNFFDIWRYTYDARNRKTQDDYPDSSKANYTYDGVGHRLTTSDEAGKVTTYSYDDAEELFTVTDALGHVTVYGYDATGNLTGVTDANNHTTSFQYDSLNRRILRSLPLGQSETEAYDAVGNVSAQTDFNGKTTTFTYDTLNRLLSKIPDASLSQPTVSFSYTPTGKRATMADASGTTTYAYDNRDRVTSKATPEGTLSYTYDAHGNVSSIVSSNANGASAAYTYNGENQLATVVDNRLLAQGAASGTTTYAYNATDLLDHYVYPNGVQTNFRYDTKYRLTQINSTKNGTLAQYFYSYDPVVNRTNVLEANSRNVAYGYDNVYKLTSETVTADPGGHNGAVNYTSYDPVGNRLAMTSTLTGVPGGSFSYDNNDRLSGDTSDANGNTISSAGIANTYDFENHMLSHGAVTMVYDGDGNRVAETVGGSTTQYLVDTVNPTGYAQVMDELVSGAVTRTYTYGLQRISENQKIGTTQTASFYGYDGHGNVRFLTGTAGTVTDTYVYDAFGLPLTTTGTTPNSFLYSGEQFDSVLGMYYLRARYYNPATGRFLTMDPAASKTCCARYTQVGNILDPASLHKYVYARNNPVNEIDPSGKDAILSYAIELGEDETTVEELRLVDLAVRDELVTACIEVVMSGLESAGVPTLEAYNIAKAQCIAVFE